MSEGAEGKAMTPGEIFLGDGDITFDDGREAAIPESTGDWPVRVGSHHHCCETSEALSFDRAAKAALQHYLMGALSLKRDLVPVERIRTIDQRSMVLNDATPDIEVDSETCEVRAESELLFCELATVTPLAQRHFLY
jgi:urease beta subunit